MMFYANLVDVEDDTKRLEELVSKNQHLSPGGYTGEMIGRKKPWGAANVDMLGFKHQFGHYETVQRCIALALALEIPVGYLAEEGAALCDDQEAYSLLDNAKDELTHMDAFLRASRGFKVSPEYVYEAFSMCQGLDGFGVHPIKLAGSLEMGLFLVTLSMLRKFGNAGLKLMVNSVSQDEAVHVLVNWHLVDKYLKADESLPFRKFRHAAIDWLCAGLKNPKYGADYWHRQSDKLMENRTAPELDWTSAGMYLAPFEVPNTSIDSYSRA